MFANWEVSKQVDTFLKSVELGHLSPIIRNRTLRDNFVNSPMYYSRSKKEITYDLDLLRKYHFDYPYLSKQEFVVLLLLQQIGMHLYLEENEDYALSSIKEAKENKEKTNELKREILINSFDKVLPLVPAKLKKYYEVLNEIYLARHDDTQDEGQIMQEYLSAHYRTLVPKGIILPTKTALNKHLRWPKAAWTETKAEILPQVLDCIFDDNEFLVKHFMNETIIVLLKDKGDIRIIQCSYYDLDEPAVSYLVDTSNFESRKKRHLQNLQEA